jgi:hypothetical protein
LKKINYILLIIFTAQSCAILDGYRDNLHSWHARELTQNEKIRIDNGDTLRKQIDRPDMKGEMIVTKGDPKFGKYNFIETGNWDEFGEYSSGSFIKGTMSVKTLYDAYGNILARTVFDKRKNEPEFHMSEIWTSEVKVFGSDSVLIQHIKTFNKGDTQTFEFNLGVLNYKEMLSDRLKTKIRIGKQITFDKEGVLKETNYRYEDKVKVK